jgi:ubiquinone/menaquinone biosynthesis C-methylase UbiE
MSKTGFQLADGAAEQYEKFNVPTMSRPAAESFLENIDIGAADRVLDLACGTGIMTRLIAEKYEKTGGVTGLDFNDGMLKVARSLSPKADFPIEWHQGDICDLALRDGQYELVLCNHGLQFIPDKAAGFSEIMRVLVPGGRLAFTVWSAEPALNVAIADAIRRHISDEWADIYLSPFSFRDGNVIHQLVEDAGFQANEMQEIEFIRRLPATASAILELAARSHFSGAMDAASEVTRQTIAGEQPHPPTSTLFLTLPVVVTAFV